MGMDMHNKLHFSEDQDHKAPTLKKQARSEQGGGRANITIPQKRPPHPERRASEVASTPAPHEDSASTLRQTVHLSTLVARILAMTEYKSARVKSYHQRAERERRVK